MFLMKMYKLIKTVFYQVREIGFLVREGVRVGKVDHLLDRLDLEIVDLDNRRFA